MGEPYPRSPPLTYEPFPWPEVSRRQLTPRTNPLDIDLVNLIEFRETRRDFRHPLDETRLGEFLWLACRNRTSRASPYGFDQESRAHPSAGAVHPIHVLVSRRSSVWHRYDPVQHSLCELPNSSDSAAAGRRIADQVIESGEAYLLVLIAEAGKTNAKYQNSDSLVWRDAGVVLGYMSLIAASFELSFCPLGASGLDMSLDFLAHGGALTTAGLAILGPP